MLQAWPRTSQNAVYAKFGESPECELRLNGVLGSSDLDGLRSEVRSRVFGLCFGHGRTRISASGVTSDSWSASPCREQPEKIGVPVFTAYVVVTLLAIAASTFVAIANFIRLKFVLSTASKVGVSESWMTTLGTLNAAAALGLLLGLIGVPPIGTAAAVGLVLYFVGAIITHLRARDYSIGPAAAFLVLAVAALVLGLAS